MKSCLNVMLLTPRLSHTALFEGVMLIVVVWDQGVNVLQNMPKTLPQKLPTMCIITKPRPSVKVSAYFQCLCTGHSLAMIV